ncbi:MAG: DUF1566 domain-containing protein [Sulfurovum sp.]|nr:DUF1566 domain-containing protein [Sulfurovaceae bacterium]
MKKIILFLASIGILVSGDVVFHKKTGLFWQDNRLTISEKITYKEAEELCQGLTIGGHQDWRIPNLKELLTIVDYKNYDPAILNGFSSIETSTYWSSTEYKGRDNEVWGVNFKTGATDSNSKNYDRYIRCVRVAQK